MRRWSCMVFHVALCWYRRPHSNARTSRDATESSTSPTAAPSFLVVPSSRRSTQLLPSWYADAITPAPYSALVLPTKAFSHLRLGRVNPTRPALPGPVPTQNPRQRGPLPQVGERNGSEGNPTSLDGRGAVRKLWQSGLPFRSRLNVQWP